MTLILAPSSPRGWFGGRALAMRDALEVRGSLGLREAGDALEATFAGAGPPLTAALVTYEGAATVLTYAAEIAPLSLAPAARGFATPLVLEPAMSSAEAYRAGVETVRERIAAGDVYVLNLTHAVTGAAVLPPAETFAALLARAGSDMSAYLETPGATLASVS
ncbi:MAG: hypothetical protein C0418_02075, partial [Coriobacteriaceae bacterium]|nr:hypothetical protein [Coriobacteriaceae bacterium]